MVAGTQVSHYDHHNMRGMCCCQSKVLRESERASASVANGNRNPPPLTGSSEQTNWAFPTFLVSNGLTVGQLPAVQVSVRKYGDHESDPLL